MEGQWHLLAYWVCFVVGLAWAVIAAVLGGIFGFDQGDVGGIDVDADGMDFEHDFGAGQDMDAGHGGADFGAAPDAPAISPLSPAVLATFVTTFGGVGVITTSMFKFPLLFSLPVSFVAGMGIAAVVFVVFYRVFQAVQASSEMKVADSVGLEAEVTVAIPKEGVGQIAYVARGGRFTVPARSEEGVEIARYAAVRISKVVGNTYHVRPLLDEELRGLKDEDAAPGGQSDPEPGAAGADDG